MCHTSWKICSAGAQEAILIVNTLKSAADLLNSLFHRNNHTRKVSPLTVTLKTK